MIGLLSTISNLRDYRHNVGYNRVRRKRSGNVQRKVFDAKGAIRYRVLRRTIGFRNRRVFLKRRFRFNGIIRDLRLLTSDNCLDHVTFFFNVRHCRVLIVHVLNRKIRISGRRVHRTNRRRTTGRSTRQNRHR